MVTFRRYDEQDPIFHREFERLSALVADMDAISRGLLPEELVEGEAPLLDRWMVASRIIPCLAGLSTGHPLLPGDNRMIGTSDLWLMSEDRTWARTLSRWYRLGRPAGQTDLQS
ncbi:DUF6634 family protein [Oricola nitratireducens]|uniref:DUF6634 family protein n=1 Tax=Oricola nitratireducens TaxID=2775868 RepID=UPI001867819C|nr:DUF6634 family protein [Oricola nitratireducens]